MVVSRCTEKDVYILTYLITCTALELSSCAAAFFWRNIDELNRNYTRTYIDMVVS